MSQQNKFTVWDNSLLVLITKRDIAMRQIFWGFCRDWFLMSSLHYLSSHSEFGFAFAEILEIKKGLSDSLSRGVDNSPIRPVGESSNHKLGESANEFLKENSLHRWAGELPTPRLGESVSLQVSDLPSQWVVDFPTRQIGESVTLRLGKSVSRCLIKILG